MLAVLLSLFVAVPALPVAMRPMILAQADQASCVVVFADGARGNSSGPLTLGTTLYLYFL